MAERITKEQLLKLADYLIDIADGYSDEETFEIDREEFERELLYDSKREV